MEGKKVKKYTLLEESEIMHILRSIELLLHLALDLRNKYNELWVFLERKAISRKHKFENAARKIENDVAFLCGFIGNIKNTIREISVFIYKEIYETNPSKIERNIRRDKALEVKLLEAVKGARERTKSIENTLPVLKEFRPITSIPVDRDFLISESEKVVNLFKSVRKELLVLFKEENIREKAELS